MVEERGVTAARTVMLLCIANADTKGHRRIFIATAYDSGLVSCAEAFALMVEWGVPP